MNDSLSFFLALGGGVLTFFSPCTLPLLPVFFSLLTGLSLQELEGAKARPWLRVLAGMLAFVAGLTVVFVLLGVGATFLGRALQTYSRWIQSGGGVIVILFGLHFMGWLRIPWLDIERRLSFPAGPFLTGLSFAFGWSPCISPILGTILLYAATQETVAAGAGLLFVYSLGFGVPFIVSGLLFHSFLSVFPVLKRATPVLHLGSGILLMVFGILLITDGFRALSSWFVRMWGG